MPQLQTSGPRAAAVGPPTDRVRLAEVALEAALKVDGVVAPHAPIGGGGSTRGSGRRLDGVSVVAGGHERFDVSLHLVTRIVPLHPLADRVRERVSRAAGRSGLGDRLGPVDVRIENLAEPPVSAGMLEAGP